MCFALVELNFGHYKETRMAYSSGTATSPNDLLDKLRIFLLANGWTVNLHTALGAGYRLHVNKGALFLNFRSIVAESLSSSLLVNAVGAATSDYAIAGYASTGFNAGSVWNDQPGGPKYSATMYGGFLSKLNGTIPAYHFFSYAGNDEIFAVIEFEPLKYQLLAFGTIAKYSGSALGGQWYSFPSQTLTADHGDGMYYYTAPPMLPFRGSAQSGSQLIGASAIKANVDGVDGWAIDAMYVVSPFQLAAATLEGWDREELDGSVSSIGWQNQLHSYPVYIVRGGLVALSPFGEILGMRRLNITNFQPAEELALGADTWKIFPLYQKNGYSAQQGYAIKKEV